MQSIKFDNSFAKQLPQCFVNSTPDSVPDPRLVYFNRPLAETLLLSIPDNKTELAQYFSGNTLAQSSQPIAQVYAGHQFGHFSPQLGDGRAVVLGEVLDRFDCRQDLALKGSGKTPFSRGGDGKATLGPMLREAIIGEAMHALGIPTTRALAVVTTGESVYRESALPGAVLVRTAQSHLRVGTFEYFAAKGQLDTLKQLADYSIARHYPELTCDSVSADSEHYILLLRAVIKRQAKLIAQWMSVGFIHGVMNTDNMTISGETIDYGPCAFMDAYHPATVYSSIDQQGRYAYGNQPAIAQWNLARFAETLIPLIATDTTTTAKEKAVSYASDEIKQFDEYYRDYWLQAFRPKIGLSATCPQESDQELIEQWLKLLQKNGVDFTRAFYELSNVIHGNETILRSLFKNQEKLDAWLTRWQQRLKLEPEKIDPAQTNPGIIPRNHLVEEALISAVQNSDLALFNELMNAVKKPYGANQNLDKYKMPADTAFNRTYQTFCGT